MFESEKTRALSLTLVAAVVLTTLVFGLHSIAFAQQTEQRPAALYRVTLIVSDIERSVDFYRRLGLTLRSDISRTSDDPGGIVSSDLFPLTDDPTRSRIVIMGGNAGTSGAVALMWYDRPPLPSARGNLMGLGTGDIVMMFQVSDIRAIYNRLDSANTRFHEPPTLFTSRGPDGERQTGQRFLAYDPDGHMVEVAQID